MTERDDAGSSGRLGPLEICFQLRGTERQVVRIRAHWHCVVLLSGCWMGKWYDGEWAVQLMATVATLPRKGDRQEHLQRLTRVQGNAKMGTGAVPSEEDRVVSGHGHAILQSSIASSKLSKPEA